ncbi:MAG: GNAT family N-acetyltransferase [Actinomycetaceae bacterium]|nr:GNAT family N-acetyltransferase [Actinomycetaceae bacterium]
MERVTLTTERLTLSPPNSNDIEAITRLCQDPAIQTWTTVPVPYTRDDAASFISDIVDAGWQAASPTWAIRFEEDGPLLGVISIADRGAAGEVGFWLSAELRGLGIMTEALGRVVDFGFEEMALPSLIWMCEIHDEPNWASAKVAWRCGFAFEGRVRGLVPNKGEARDALVASLLPSDSHEPKGPWFGPSTGHPGFADPRDPEALVRQFHEVYDLPIVTDGASVDRDRVHMRYALIAEEFGELTEAIYGRRARDIIDDATERAVAEDDLTRNTVAAADALGDIIYVVYGMALEMGIPLRDVLAQIQASNLSKLGADGKPVYREDGKVLKGPNYFPPDIGRALGLE